MITLKASEQMGVILAFIQLWKEHFCLDSWELLWESLICKIQSKFSIALAAQFQHPANASPAMGFRNQH